MQRVKLFAQRSHIRTKAISLFIDGDDYRAGDKTYRRLKSIEFADVVVEDVQFMPEEPKVDMSNESAQELFNSLWGMGFRPANEDGTAGMLQATQDHLGDMRKIVSEKLKVTL